MITANINKSYIPKMREEWTEIYASTIRQRITMDWVYLKTDVLRMCHEGDKISWFNYILW